MQKVDFSGDCWMWSAALNRQGYGQFHDRVGGGLKMVRAHRYSYEVFVGPVPEGEFVCHSCDVRDCVNPDHLWTGTAADNNRDMMEKGRMNVRDNARKNPNREEWR